MGPVFNVEAHDRVEASELRAGGLDCNATVTQGRVTHKEYQPGIAFSKLFGLGLLGEQLTQLYIRTPGSGTYNATEMIATGAVLAPALMALLMLLQCQKGKGNKVTKKEFACFVLANAADDELTEKDREYYKKWSEKADGDEIDSDCDDDGEEVGVDVDDDEDRERLEDLERRKL
jgi:hypothetical protein